MRRIDKKGRRIVCVRLYLKMRSFVTGLAGSSKSDPIGEGRGTHYC